MLIDFHHFLRYSMISITHNARNQLMKICKSNEYIKLYVLSGGCSGIQWDMKNIFKNEIHKNDEIVNDKLVIDHHAIFHLLKCKLDYKTTLKSSGFVLENPNASHTCGCGKSFSFD